MSKLAALVFALSLAGCRPAGGYVLSTPHFSATYARGWVASREHDEDHVYLFRHPARNVEVRVFGWLVRAPLDQPNAAALALLGASAVPTTGQKNDACPEGEANLSFLGQKAPVARLSVDQLNQTLLVAGHAEGSLVAVVARPRDPTPQGCAGVRQLRADVQDLLAGFGPSGMPQAPGPDGLSGTPRRSFPPGVCAHDPSVRHCLMGTSLDGL